MKIKRNLIIILLLVCSYGLSSQSLTVGDLINISKKKNWTEVDKFLKNRGWRYSEAGSDENLGHTHVVWSYDKIYGTDMAPGWLRFVTSKRDNEVVAVGYQLSSEKSYKRIENSLAPNGFENIDSYIEERSLIYHYASKLYDLFIKTSTNASSGNPIYYFTLTKKEDPNNGHKKEYNLFGALVKEYHLKNGKLHGKYKEYNFLGDLIFSGNLVNDKQHGCFKEYSDSGVLLIEYNAANDELNGPYKEYYENGKLYVSGNYLKGKEHGKFREYSEDGVLLIEYNAANDELNGPYKEYYENGKLHISGNYSRGKKHGKFYEYSEDGVLLFEYSVLNDELSGVFKRYYGNGNLELKRIYKNGLIEGLATQYNKWGDVIAEKTYKNDLLHGRSKFFDFNCIIYIDFVLGKKEGVERWYFTACDNKKTEIYYCEYSNDMKNGTCIDHTARDSMIVSTYVNDKLDGNYRIYSSDIAQEDFCDIVTDTTQLHLVTNGYYENGLKQGKWHNYLVIPRSEDDMFIVYKVGALFEEIDYKDDVINGNYIRYLEYKYIEMPCDLILEDGTVIKDTSCKINPHFKNCYILNTYVNGILHGYAVYEDRDNRLIYNGNFHNDKRHGQWIFYEEKSSTIKGNDSTYLHINYEFGEKEGLFKRVDNNKETLETWYYKDNELDGKATIYGINAKEKAVMFFSKGTLRNMEIDDSVKIKYQISPNESGNINYSKTTYSDKGYTKANYILNKNILDSLSWHEIAIRMYENQKYDVLEGTYDDEYFIYDDEDMPLVKGEYMRGRKISTWEYYDYSEGIIHKITYTNKLIYPEYVEDHFFTLEGKPFSGTYLKVSDDNEIIEKIRIRKGVRHGNTHIIDSSTNKVIEKRKYKKGLLKNK